MMDARDWLIKGGGRFEGGEMVLCDTTFSSDGLIEIMDAYREYVIESFIDELGYQDGEIIWHD